MHEKLIIHVTKTIESLQSILRSSSLKLSYSSEDFCVGQKKISSAAHPMVCFCEYSIAEIDSKIITYGKYGISFSTSWALRKRISPVLYIDDNSLAAKGLGNLLRARQNNKKGVLPKHLRLPIMEIKCFTKNVRGLNSHLNEKNFNFKDENEWRYVPDKQSIGNNLISQNKTTYKKNKAKYNNKLLPYPFKFKLSDVEVFFVSNKNEIPIISKEFAIDIKKIRVSKWKTTITN